MSVPSRETLLARGVRLEGALIAWNVLEGIIAVAAGVVASSVALISFGVDSFIEVTSAAVVLWRLRAERRGHRPERAELRERTAARIAGGLLFVLAAYIVVDAGRRLLGFGEAADASLPGIALTAASLVVMPLFGWAKLRTARQLNSGALRADAYETIACAWLSAATLLGLALNATVGWVWADPAAALLIVPLVLREGWEGWRGHGCHACGVDEAG